MADLALPVTFFAWGTFFAGFAFLAG